MAQYITQQVNSPECFPSCSRGRMLEIPYPSIERIFRAAGLLGLHRFWYGTHTPSGTAFDVKMLSVLLGKSTSSRPRPQVDGTSDNRITIRGSGDKEKIQIRGAGDQSRVFEVMHDFYTIAVGPSSRFLSAGGTVPHLSHLSGQVDVDAMMVETPDALSRAQTQRSRGTPCGACGCVFSWDKRRRSSGA